MAEPIAYMAEDAQSVRRTTEVDATHPLPVGLIADLQAGVNKYVYDTITLAATDYSIEIPDNAKYVTLSGDNNFRYNFGAAVGVPLVTGAGNVLLAGLGVGNYYDVIGSVKTHILAAGVGRKLYLRSSNAVVHVAVNFA